MVALYELMELLPNDFTPSFSGRLHELFLFLDERKKRLTEEEATICFLGDKQQRKYYNKLKNKLKQELVKYIIRNPLWTDKAYKSLYQSCYANFTAYKILLMNGKRGAAIEMAKPLLLKLRTCELHSLLHIVASDLNLYYSSINVIPTLANKYRKIAMEQLEFVKSEAVVREHHNKVLLIKNTRESYTKAMLEVFQEACAKTIPLLKLKSNTLNRFIYNIIITRYIAEFNYEKIIEYCDEAYSSFPLNHPNQKALKFGYIQMKLLPLVAIGKFDLAKQLAKESCQIPAVGGFNWHYAFIRRCLICLHASQYQEAYDLYKEQEKQDCQFPSLSEYWTIIWGYLYFLIKIGRIKEYTEERFHLGKFLNEMPIYSKDKAGNNVNLLFVQILIRLYREQYGQIIDRIEALDTYARTYTKKPETIRTNIFLNMLIKMEGASFHRVATERKTQKLFEKLQKTPLRLGQNLAVEIIPFDILWNEILELLGNKIYSYKGARLLKERNRTVKSYRNKF